MLACQEKPQAKHEPAETQTGEATTAKAEWKTHRWSGYQVLRELPHDNQAYTQGLYLSNGHWMESTGGHGTSNVRRVEKETGRVLAKVDLDKKYFGEGITELNGKLYQLTWQSQQGFVYDSESLKPLGSFTYQGEGWGLTTDGQSLIMSDGTDRLRFLDPKTLRVQRVLPVSYGGKPVRMLNELEFIEGEIFANVWHTQQIVRINPTNGQVIGVIDLTGIYPDAGKRNPEFVLNGIAYDAACGDLFVTGKCWPKIYQIRLVKKR
ncbi:glutaminyl-peptide cyclotransferase [Verrucomicrobiaceae bacterium R5-34]|uniref:Glutaminyl-peptide cyclotransferase n=1 Tax=Oceaniferula flava TaxID=2800421 RepID=A0AAE2VBF9_9BACT|nr:glutaminyl-peptide cyclotransferase [Oceaniferula flavus]MBK1829477.1 glutaminyl-peptide cyclotransferase [Verrucomicrobiaceae bacterium R5-34]MBK1853706.1 glutaminyl-peptide cyclotransferase [Oceaniferula flavus]MBM1135012.1 glutaminyl-peptide cyclotransferase [Oceaniferula flavus]